MTIDPADLEPFWCAREMRRESLLFTAAAAGGVAIAPLLFPPSGPVQLTSADGLTTFIEGVDFEVDHASGWLRVPVGSPVPFVTAAQLHPAPGGGDAFMHVRGNPDRLLWWAEGDAFHRVQVAASYAHAPDLWRGHVPGYAGDALPAVRARLGQRAPLTVCVTGDSISEGYNASGFTGVPPWQPPYAPLVAAGLEQHYGAPVVLHNLAQAGTASSDGRYLAAHIAAHAPHLVIVAFGMNDAGYMDSGEYGANIHGLITAVRDRLPAAEFVLVAPMLPHPEWHYTAIERFSAYRDALAGLCGHGVVLADVTQVWEDVLTRKRAHDLTGNGINHPNDFGHRLYAQVVLARLCDPAQAR